MRINKNILLWTIKKSASISEVAQRLGKDSADEEKIWDKMLHYYSAAEDFLNRNEAAHDMKESFSNEDWEAVKEARYAFIAATNRLIQNKLITEKDINRLAAKLENKRNQQIVVPASKESTDVKITSPVPQDLAASIILK